MESLSYGFEACEPSFTDDIELQMDRLVNRNLLKGWDSEPLPTLVADGVYDIGIVEPFSPDEKRKSVLSNQCLGGSVDETDIDFGKSALSNSTVTLNSLAHFGRKISSSSINENFAHTELEMVNSARVSSLNQISNENLGLSSREPPVSNKRARITNLQSQHPVCIVYGCNKDLSSLKDYHKRHKVCDIHAKTSVVIVNGTKQRFCQQCSRFHVLAEFDEDKRSCRKRLAGHNERRRKPQLDNHFGTDLSSASLVFSEIFPGVMFGKGPTSYSRNTLIAKYEPTQIFQSALPSKDDLSLAKPVIHPSTTCLNAPLSVGSNSSCALSLLSQNSVTNSAGNGISMARPLIFKENLCTNFHGNLDFTTKSALSFLTPSAFNSSGEVEQGVSDTNISTGFEIPQNDFFQEANAFKCFPSPESADTVDLLQLSLHLQRVEQQKYSAQVKQENGGVYRSTIT